MITDYETGARLNRMRLLVGADRPLKVAGRGHDVRLPWDPFKGRWSFFAQIPTRVYLKADTKSRWPYFNGPYRLR